MSEHVLSEVLTGMKRLSYLKGWNAAIKASKNASLQSCVVAKNAHDVGCDTTAYEIEKRISRLKPPEEE